MGKLNFTQDTVLMSLPERIDYLRDRFGLSLNDMSRRMGYADRSSVKQARKYPDRVSTRFLAALDRLEIELLNERGLLYDLVDRDTLPKNVVVCVRRRGELVPLSRAVRRVVR